MAKYTEKTQADLAWDKIRREVQYRVNLWAANKRAELLNVVLPPLQDEFEASLNRGVLMELESGETATFLERLLEDSLAEADSL